MSRHYFGVCFHFNSLPRGLNSPNLTDDKEEGSTKGSWEDLGYLARRRDLEIHDKPLQILEGWP